MVKISLKNTFISLSFDDDEGEETTHYHSPLGKRSVREGDASNRSRSADCFSPSRLGNFSVNSSHDSADEDEQQVELHDGKSQIDKLNKLLDTSEQSTSEGSDQEDVVHLQKEPSDASSGVVCSVGVVGDSRVTQVEASHSWSNDERRLWSDYTHFPLDDDVVPDFTPKGKPATRLRYFNEPQPVGPLPPSQQTPERPWSASKVTSSKGSGVVPKEYRHGHVPKTLNLEVEYKYARQNRPATTLMIRNIPNRYTQKELVAELEDLGFCGSFDFLYLPLDKGTMANVGYCFINFVEHTWADRCMHVFQNYSFRRHRRHSRKVAAVSVAHIQGLEANLMHYQTAAVNTAKLKQRRPLIVPHISEQLYHASNMASPIMDGYDGCWQLPPPR